MRSVIRKQMWRDYDACRKIAILASLISGQQVDFEDNLYRRNYKDHNRRYEVCQGDWV